MDAISSFAYIVDNLPEWKQQVDQLSTYTSQKHEEFRAEYARLVSQAKPRRVKSTSICSIHTGDEVESSDNNGNDSQHVAGPDLVNISPFEAGNRYIYAQANRKRKPGTSLRSGASGPMKFRNKQMVVIYFDSHVQDQLDALVKAIGGSRNNLRKGKMAFTVKNGFQLPSLGKRYDSQPTMLSLDGVRSSSMYRNPSKMLSAKSEAAAATTDAPPTGEAAFKQADKDLEACQNLCETAAHQFLRDGDCKLELDAVVQNLDRVLSLAKTTLETLKAEEAKDETASAEDASVSGSTRAASEATLVSKTSRETFNFSRKIAPRTEEPFHTTRPVLPTTISAPPAPPTTTEIEVDDDSDQSSIEIDMSKYRMTSRAGLRA